MPTCRHGYVTVNSEELNEVRVVLELGCELIPLGHIVRDGNVISLELRPDRLLPGGLLGPDVLMHPGRIHPAAGFPIFGFAADSSPDRWGRELMRRRASAEKHAKPRQLGPWDFLLQVQDAGRHGAIRYFDPASGEAIDNHPSPIPGMVNLRELEHASLGLEHAIEQDDLEQIDAWLRVLVAPGSSLGGARPKANVVDPDGQLHIAKFPSRNDTIDSGLWEHIYAELGHRAGTNPLRSRVARFAGHHHTFLAPRFDRRGDQRLHYLSAMTLTGKQDGESASYLNILEALDDHGDPMHIAADRRLLYRRMLFNVLMGNRDDHLRNHGFLITERGARLTPCFDVNPSLDKLDHATSLDCDSSEPDLDAALACADMFGLNTQQANSVLNELRDSLANWKAVAKSLGGRSAEIRLVEAVIHDAVSG